MSITDEGEYGKKQIDTLEMIWGEGYLSPGGASEIDLILNGKSLKNMRNNRGPKLLPCGTPMFVSRKPLKTWSIHTV